MSNQTTFTRLAFYSANYAHQTLKRSYAFKDQSFRFNRIRNSKSFCVYSKEVGYWDIWLSTLDQGRLSLAHTQFVNG